MKETTKTYVAASGASATNPGKMPINYLQWFKSYPMWPALITCCIALFTYLGLNGSWLWWIPAILAVGLGIFIMLRCHDIFVIGDVNPGIVVQESPLLIAVSTHMDRFGGEDFPVCAVVGANVPSPYRRLGSKVPMVCIYSNFGKEFTLHWKRLHPRSNPRWHHR